MTSHIAPAQVDIIGPISPGDLEELLTSDRSTARPSVKRIKDSHHNLARILASGITPAEASAITGYDNVYISILQADPAFQDLMSHYREMENAAAANLAERLATLALDATQELQDRLAHQPEKIDTKDLLKLVEKAADRTGHGPKSTTVSVHIGLAEKLEAARRRVPAPPGALVLDVKP